MSDQASIEIGGVLYEGWTRISVARSLEAAASTFALELVHSAESPPAVLRQASPVRVWLGDTPVLAGHIESVAIGHAADARSIQVAGRSRTGDLVDCSAIHPSGRWGQVTIGALAAELASPFGVEVLAVPTAPMKHALEPGETVFDTIERAARYEGLLVTDDAEGRLVLARAGATRADVALEAGQNILRSELSTNAAQRFTQYIIRGQRAGDDLDFGSTINRVEASATDDQLPRYRPLVLRAERAVTPEQALARARFEAMVRAARSTQVHVAVVGWRQTTGGRLWTVGELVRVADPALGVDADFVVVSVSFALDESGSITELELQPPEGFGVLSEPRKATGTTRKVGAWAELEGGV